MKNIDKYLKQRTIFPYVEVSLGFKAVYVYTPEELEKGQIGYRVDSNGNSLIGKGVGDWLDKWVIIGYEDMCGDPIFIDISDISFPVYTAMSGTGEWEPSLIAKSFKSFVEALAVINETSKDRKNPNELECNPIADEEKEEVSKKISFINAPQDIDMSFWLDWLEY